MTETDLLDLGIWRVPVPIPFPQAGGPVNVYLLEEKGGGVALFDAGLGTAEAEATLADGFKALGRKFSEVRRIYISHGHIDHFGAARTVQEWHGGELPVFAHRGDWTKLLGRGGQRWGPQREHYLAYAMKLGVPPEALAAMGAEGQRTGKMARRLDAVGEVGEGDRLELRHLDLEVQHMPGHTPGVICLYDRKHRILFSDDHLLEKVSPNPLIELGPNGEEGFWKPLVNYDRSIRRARELEVDLVLPGHATPFSGHRKVIDSLLSFYEKRQGKILAALAARPLNAWEAVREIFPKARPIDNFLMLSEVVANLEVLEEKGAVARELEGGEYRFRLVPR
jgi:glyoxylase-like metal-dependent hydrolase (beta-lactamase superfamily II)